MVGYEQILDQAEGYVRKWLPHAQNVKYCQIPASGLQAAVGGQQPATAFQALFFPLNQMVIGVDGRVGLCCEDINLEVPVGKIQERSIIEVYNHSRELKKYRQAHERQDLRQLPLCSDCHVWGGDISLTTELVTIDGVQAQKTTTHALHHIRKYLQRAKVGNQQPGVTVCWPIVSSPRIEEETYCLQFCRTFSRKNCLKSESR
ncbi:MAG: SPASM domain-containing protein [Desulfovermiculus sp.]|nr:SPASM domain-containing protein [Desulfovermiculus sp.]